MARTYDPAVDDFSPDDLGPRRTSILAIISLILSLICIIPGAGLLGAIFGLAGIIGISQSRGRVGGMGLAIAGLALGLLFSALWIGFGIGASRVYHLVKQTALTPVTATMTAIEAGDRAGSRAAMLPDAAAAATDAQLDAFRDAYRAELGNFITIPQNLMDIWIGYGSAGHVLEGQQLNNVIPFPAQFDKGWTIVAVEIKPEGSGRAKGAPPPPPAAPGTAAIGPKDSINITNIHIFALDGKSRISLFPPGTPISPAPTTPGPETPAAPDAIPTPPDAGSPPAQQPEPR